jgi:hypothetical protein
VRFLRLSVALELYPRVGAGSPVFRYTVVVPFEQLRPTKKPKATPQDLEGLEQLLIRDFAGLATPVACPGYGLRDPSPVWLGSGFTKTQYATHFTTAHENVGRILDFAREEGCC